MPADEGWRLRAACRGSDTGLFFPQRGSAVAQMKAVKAVCETCKVQGPCDAEGDAEAGVAEHKFLPYGAWAGISEKQRKARRTKRRKAAKESK